MENDAALSAFAKLSCFETAAKVKADSAERLFMLSCKEKPLPKRLILPIPV